MFYVIYNPDTKLYADEDGKWGPYDKAEQFNQPSPAMLFHYEEGSRWVGPCQVGEEP